ncbi:hypothetical protein Peur_057708 [Populus x canadensis]
MNRDLLAYLQRRVVDVTEKRVCTCTSGSNNWLIYRDGSELKAFVGFSIMLRDKTRGFRSTRGEKRERERRRQETVEFTWGERVREIRESVEENTTCLCPPPELTWTSMSCLETRAIAPPRGPHCLSQQ